MLIRIDQEFKIKIKQQLHQTKNICFYHLNEYQNLV